MATKNQYIVSTAVWGFNCQSWMGHGHGCCLWNKYTYFIH